MPPKAKARARRSGEARARRWPSRWVVQELVQQTNAEHIDNIEASMHWLLSVYPGAAIALFLSRHLLTPLRRDVAQRWGERYLRPGNFDPTGLEELLAALGQPLENNFQFQ